MPSDAAHTAAPARLEGATPSVTDADLASREAGACLTAEREALDAAQQQARAAGNKAAASKRAVDRNAAKRARHEVNRIATRVADARQRSRQLREELRVAQVEARLAKRVQAIEDDLTAATLAAESQLEKRLERAVAKFRAEKLAQLTRADARTRRRRAAAAAARIKALHETHASREMSGAWAATGRVGSASKRRTREPAVALPEAGI